MMIVRLRGRMEGRWAEAAGGVVPTGIGREILYEQATGG
jgi:putative Mn2+ efflux pump MntP